MSVEHLESAVAVEDIMSLMDEAIAGVGHSCCVV